MPWPFHCWAACSSSVHTPTIYRRQCRGWRGGVNNLVTIWVIQVCLFSGHLVGKKIPKGPKSAWREITLIFKLTWRKLTDPNGVWIGCICGSSVSNICWIRDSLLSSGLCHDTWSPLQNVFSVEGEQKETFILLKAVFPLLLFRGRRPTPNKKIKLFSHTQTNREFASRQTFNLFGL